MIKNTEWYQKKKFKKEGIESTILKFDLDNEKELRIWVLLYNTKDKFDERVDNKNKIYKCIGMFERYKKTKENDRDIGVILLCKETLTLEDIAHEAYHAIHGILRWKKVRYAIKYEEELAELNGQIVGRLYKYFGKYIHTEEEQHKFLDKKVK